MRRNARVQRRKLRGKVDPFHALQSDYAWRAADAVTLGGVTESLPPYRGALTLSRQGTGQAPKAASTNFPQAPLAIPFTSTAAIGAYGASLATPAAYTIATVLRATASQSGAHSFTVGGTQNTGTSSGTFVLGTLQGFAQKVLASNQKTVGALPLNMVIVATFDSAGYAVYPNSYTPATGTQAGALVGDTFTIGALATSGGYYLLGGEWVATGLWNRVLTSTEITALLAKLGAIYGVTISP